MKKQSLKLSKRTYSKVQATEITYELHTLGWKAFQNLCVTIVRDLWGQTVQTFFDSNDGGRDGAFHGEWTSKDGAVYNGTFTVQCKFTLAPNKQLHLSDLKDELKKAQRLVQRKLADNYFLFTNARLTGTSEDIIRKAFLSHGVKQFKAYGAEGITKIIRESSKLRMLVPRIYGLGDLSQIIDERACDQAKEILSAIGDDLAKFVITDSYRKAAKALVEHSFVLLLGEPACGKSTIAAALSLGALDQWGCQTFKIRNASEFISHSNPHESKQFFWVDDAFGATQFDLSCVADWNSALPYIHAAIKRGAKVLFTSRDYIYHAAKQHLKESALPIICESQVVIYVEEISKDEREQILYNHIRHGSQTQEVKTQLKPFLEKIANHSRFMPEIARRLGNPLFTSKLLFTEDKLNDFIEHPIELLKEIISTIDVHSRSALALIFMRGGILNSPCEMTNIETNAIERIGGSQSGVYRALIALNTSLTLRILQDGNSYWKFKHPTIRDAFAAHIAENPELLDIYLAGTPLDTLFQEVTCGKVELAGAKVIVPVSRYDMLISRIISESEENNYNKWQFYFFLSQRCDKLFLKKITNNYPLIIDELKISIDNLWTPEVNVFITLHKVGLLPEKKRAYVIDKIREVAVETPDAGFLRDCFIPIFKDHEKESILDDVKDELLPNLEDTIDNWKYNFCEDSDANAYFDGLIETLKSYRDCFMEDHKAVAQIDNALHDLDRIIEELSAEQSKNEDQDDDFQTHKAIDETQNRSIFDDVDQ